MPFTARLVRQISICLLLFSGSIECHAQQATGVVTPGGIRRYRDGQWGLVKGQFNNFSDQDQTLTAIVTQKSGSGDQFARSAQVPAGVSRVTQWPLLAEASSGGVYEFEYLFVNEQDGRETVARRQNDSIVETFVVPGNAGNWASEPSFSGHLSAKDVSDAKIVEVSQMLEAFRKASQLPNVMLNLTHEDVHGSLDALSPLNNLVITSPDLWRFQETCDAIRFWIERGGRAIVFLDSVGEDSTRAILGDALPFSVVDTTQLHRFILDNHEVDGNRTNQASYEVRLEEPVPLVRAVFDRGLVKWSQAGWPVVVEVPVGRGSVHVVTMPASVLVSTEDSEKLAACANGILEEVFKNPIEQSLLTRELLSSVGQQQIGYSIPERWFPAIVLGAFILVLVAVSFVLTRSHQQNRLLVAVPVCAVAAMTPGLLTGMASRTTAPATMIQTRVVQAPPGQTSVVADGVVTIYQPESQKMDLVFRDHGTVADQRDVTTASRRRFVWSDNGTYTWEGFLQPAGVTSYNEQSILRLKDPLNAIASFEGDYVVIRVLNSETLAPEDAVIAGPGPDRMEARLAKDGLLHANVNDVLPPGEISNATLLSQKQLQRKVLYNALFTAENRLTPFPPEPTLLFWSGNVPSGVDSSSSLKNESSTLITLPLDLQKPEIGRQILIPPVLLPYASVLDEHGAMGSAFGNRQRTWMQRKPSGTVVLKFQIPPACQPFHSDDASLELRIHAGSRTVKIGAGRIGDFTEVTSLNSPVGSLTINLPSDVLNAAADTGAVFLEIHVGQLELASANDEQATIEQDNFWKVDRVLLTLKGHRTKSAVPSK